MLCDHNNSDTYSVDGNFYKLVGECKKRNCPDDQDIQNSDDIDLIWKAWNCKH